MLLPRDSRRDLTAGAAPARCRTTNWGRHLSGRRSQPTLALLHFIDFLDEGRDDVKQVSYYSVGRQLENRRFLVFVDRQDRTGILHSDLVLDRTRNTQRDIKFRSHRLTRASDLPVHGEPAAVADRTRCTD